MGALALVAAARGACADRMRALGSWLVKGRGWGHGVGMSSYGTYGFARHGRTYGQMLAHYYRGTHLGHVKGRAGEGAAVGRDELGHLLERDVGLRSAPAAEPRLPLRRRRGRASRSLTRLGARDRRLRQPRGGGGRPDSRRRAGHLPRAARGARGRRHTARQPGGARGLHDGRGAERGDPELAAAGPARRRRSPPAPSRSRASTAARSTSTTTRAARSTRASRARSPRPTGPSARAAARSSSTTSRPPPPTTRRRSGGHTESIQFAFVGAHPVPYLKGVRDPFDGVSPLHTWRLHRLSPGRPRREAQRALLGTPPADQGAEAGHLAADRLRARGRLAVSSRVTGAELRIAPRHLQHVDQLQAGAGEGPAAGGQGPPRRGSLPGSRRGRLSRRGRAAAGSRACRRGSRTHTRPRRRARRRPPCGEGARR